MVSFNIITNTQPGVKKNIFKIAGPSVKELSRLSMAIKLYKALKNHRIRIHRAGKDVEHYFIANLCCGQAHLPLHKVAQSPIQPDPEYFQVGVIYKNTNRQVVFDH